MKKNHEGSRLIVVILNKRFTVYFGTILMHVIVSYWKIGEIIVRYDQNNSIRAEYGEQTLKQL